MSRLERFFISFVLISIIGYIYIDINIQEHQLEQIKLINEQLSYIKTDLNGETY